MTEDRGDFKQMSCDTWQERQERMDKLVELYIKTIDYFDETKSELMKDADALEEHYAARSALQAILDVFEVLEIKCEVEALADKRIKER